MSRIPRVLVVLLGLSATLLLLAPAQAAEGPGQGRRQGGQRRGMMMAQPGGGSDMIWLLRSEKVQKELELVADQKEKLKTIAEETQAKMREVFSGIRDLKPEERRAKFAELREKNQAQVEKTRQRIQEILLPHQRERLEQIQIQLQGVAALGDKKVSEALGITEEQKSKLQSVRERIQEKRQALFGGFRDMAPEERQSKMAEARKQAQQLQEEAVQQALGVLTTEQRESFEKMKGEKFELDRSELSGQNNGERGRRGPGGRSSRQAPPKE